MRKLTLLKKIISNLLLVAAMVTASSPLLADIAVVVHPSNPLASLSEDDVRRIFMGRMRLFPDSGTSVEVVDQEESRPPFVGFYSAVARLTPAKLKRQRASYLFSGKGRLPATLQDDAAVLEFVASHPGAIGYVSQESIDTRVKSVLMVRQ